jgi:glycosyltransferase involved in cell wall biosynthesis
VDDGARPRSIRLAVYTDYAYHRGSGGIYAERAFAIFLSRLRPRFERLVLVGRLSPPGGSARYPVGDAGFLELPYYSRLSKPFDAVPALARSLGTLWRGLKEVDCVWVLGPHPLAIVFALLARARRRRAVLGVRQDLPSYVRSRHPRRPDLRALAVLLEAAFRLLARFLPVIVVGPELARSYRRSPALLEIAVSLVSGEEIVSSQEALGRSYDAELRVLSVGRLEGEKNPLLLAEVLARLNRGDRRWRLIVCGEGELRERLAERLIELGQEGNAELRGYVPFGEELARLYRESHVLLHSSWTEGLPQVLLEAFAAGLPVVAPDVGGIGAAVGNAVMLVPPGEPDAAALAVSTLARDRRLREQVIPAGLAYVRDRTSESEVERVAAFLACAR